MACGGFGSRLGVLQSGKRALALATLLIIAVVPAMAFGNPPDPGWIAGFWDNGDYDDVVLLVQSTFGIAQTDPFVATRPSALIVDSIPYDDDRLDTAPAVDRRSSRAPPIR